MPSVTLTLPEALKRAIAANNHSKFSEAEQLCHAMIAAKHDFFEALHLLAVVQTRLGHLKDALTSYEQALAVRPAFAETLHNRGITLEELKRFEEALASYERALAMRADYAEALNNRGNVLKELKRFEEALASYERALAVRPDFAEPLNNRGITLEELKRFEEALASYERALAVRPDYAKALNNRGNVLRELKRFEEALPSYERALAVRADYAEALNNRGVTLQELKRFEEALESYEQALALRPAFAEALNNHGIILHELRRFEEAMESHEKALALEPNHKHALSGLAHCVLIACDWPRRQNLFGELVEHIREKKSVISPAVFLSYSGEQSLHLVCAKNYLRHKIPFGQPLWRGAVWRNKKIKVAYLCADFRRHATAYLAAELFELHDRSRFEVIGVSFGPDDGSEMRRRLVRAFDRFFDVTRQSDRDVARLLHDLRVDITIDLQGYYGHARPGIFAFRPTPIQVNYLAFPGTTGAEFMDYIIADEIVLPLYFQPYYTEKIVHLPGCYQVNDRKRTIAARASGRTEVGLPAEGFVFCCFNNNWKITPAVFDVWMRLLHAVDGSVLWLLSDNKHAERNLRHEAAARGIDSWRIIFADRTNLEEHLARHRVADLFLDTIPYNAHTTTSDALWAGLPVVTYQGETFAGRVASSLLHSIGLSELVTHSMQEYELLAMRLAQDPKLLRTYRDRLAENRLTCPLFDTDRFRRHIEAAYRHMWELWQRGKKPESFAVAAIADGHTPAASVSRPN
jgi:protein O-GlcNAc transferase